jgi:cyclic-di-AMP phosphodiesterase PgpH
MKNTGKKKGKRIDSRRAIESDIAARRQRFYDSGAPASILMLVLFIVLATLILSLNISIQGTSGNIWPGPKILLVYGVIIMFLSIGMGLYVAAHQRRIIQNHLRGGVLLTCLLIMIVLVRLGVRQDWSAYLIVVPVMITATMMTIAYSQRFALGLSAFLGMVSMLALAENEAITFREGMGALLATGSGTGIAILMLREIRTRTKLIEVCCVAGIIVFVMTVVFEIWQNNDWQSLLWKGAWGAGGTVAVGFVMQGLLPLIERVFRVCTNMTLLDYSGATRPLLKRLAVEAPGTFNHSWQIGMLSEAAAEAIGANGLLCRVGSYYHDVGKLIKPRYFVENQAENVNQHKELSPTMSRMIIIGHVKDGLELLREYKIPKVLHQFTATHHGTTVVVFFYHEATKKESEDGRVVPDTEFRYPGPKPQTKESAIVMLADAVEGASRAMQEPTPSRIENVVTDMAMIRLQDGQFDECDLTMRELHQIEESLVKSLCGMYHGRIAYPKQEKPAKNQTDTTKNNSGQLN